MNFTHIPSNQIVEVKQNWPNEYFRIDLYVGNICNFQCWYCWPESHAGDIKWPDYDLLVTNLSHLLNYYLEHTDKKKFQIAMLGGEVTHWPQFLNFIQYFKDRYDCIFSMHTNASKKLDWWATAATYLDAVSISHHAEFSNASHNKDVADYLYSKNVIVNIQVMMDPTRWDQCVQAVEYFKSSKYWWSIRQIEIIHADIKYSTEQKKTLDTLRTRGTNPWFYFRNNKIPSSKVSVIDTAGKTYKVDDHALLTDRLNNFRGWECNVGVDWLNIKPDGTISGICGNKLYDQSAVYNIFDKNFTETFQPTITTTVCQTDCWCTFEINMPKRKLTNTTKIIPIRLTT
jgi:MoaA/NifB/PqqE/SkfB family radical SAM enzyme